ncbi:hypothetical protein ABZX77_07835 [Streptomyces sp. NPDC004237]|uniref:hypothetical protein n=1 Tax=Streptomyces sp. NPDC004237 TaxID=3154455 RepID=UPI0033BB9CE4
MTNSGQERDATGGAHPHSRIRQLPLCFSDLTAVCAPCDPDHWKWISGFEMTRRHRARIGT